MEHLDGIAERIHQAFETRTAIRDRVLAQTRTLTRHCANAIRAVHRGENELAEQNLAEAGKLANSIRTMTVGYSDLYYAGYSQDALKELAEASIVYALLNNGQLPTPQALQLEDATYLQGLAEAVGELRRRSLDALLKGESDEAQRLLVLMDDIYAVLVTMDYPDAITGGLRRLTDIARSLIERTRGDLTLSLRQEHLERSLKRVEERLGKVDG
ncbi:MAG: haloacid dehalogenase [Chloroflexota bacterium]